MKLNTTFLRRTARLVILPVTTLVIGIGFGAAEQDDKLFQISKNLDIFGTVFNQLNKYYVDETKPGELMKTGIDAMLLSLDPYTNYYAEEEIEDYKFMVTGAYGGVGAVFRQIGKKLVVAEPYEGFAAQKSGLRAGDELLEVNNVSTAGKNLEDLSKVLKGTPKTPVKLKIQRPGETKPIELVVIREEIQTKAVPYSTILKNQTGYIKLNQFTETASNEVREAFLDLKQKGITSLILDLRGNPGGLVREAVSIVNLFVDKGQLVVSTRGRVKDWDHQYRTENTPVDTQIPLVVITDKGSASASEIVSGTLQDLDRAVVLGQRSFGKGLVQQTVPLVYNTQMKITVAKYYTPSGRCLQALDYSNRKGDGSVGHVPDSLITAFKTKNGRIVWDGLGIIPDVEVEKRKYSILADTLLAQAYIFDYATIYAQGHPTIADADQFQLSDTEYDAFVSWCKSKNVNYQTRSEKKLDEFKKQAEKEGSFAPLAGDFEQLKKKTGESKNDDFTEFKAEIKILLEAEIASRYYYQKGRVASSLKDDTDMKEAFAVLGDAKRYRSILTTVGKMEKPLQRNDNE
jgi:carboxyl-terminal processing protease